MRGEERVGGKLTFGVFFLFYINANFNRIEAISRDVRVMAVGEFSFHLLCS